MRSPCMHNDPPIRKDGRCHCCTKKRNAVAVKHLDPFATTECCKKHYGVLPSAGDDPVELAEAA